jgi:hypothetical protein
VLLHAVDYHMCLHSKKSNKRVKALDQQGQQQPLYRVRNQDETKNKGKYCPNLEADSLDWAGRIDEGGVVGERDTGGVGSRVAAINVRRDVWSRSVTAFHGDGRNQRIEMAW